MFRTIVFLTALGASVVVAQGCGASPAGQTAPATALAGAQNPAMSGGSGISAATAVSVTPESPTPITNPAAGSGGHAAPPSAAGMHSGIAGVAAAGSTQASAGGAALAQQQRIPCDVDAVVADRCRSCHGARLNLGAPMSLVTWSDFQKPALSDQSKKVYEVVGARVQDTARPMPPAMDGKIAVADRTLLTGWTMQGAPALPSDAADCTK